MVKQFLRYQQKIFDMMDKSQKKRLTAGIYPEQELSHRRNSPAMYTVRAGMYSLGRSDGG